MHVMALNLSCLDFKCIDRRAGGTSQIRSEFLDTSYHFTSSACQLPCPSTAERCQTYFEYRDWELTLKATCTSRKNGSPMIQTSASPLPSSMLTLDPVSPPARAVPTPILDSTTMPIQYPLPVAILPSENLPPGVKVSLFLFPFNTWIFHCSNSK